MNRSDVFKLFGRMRHSTPEEQEAYREMLKKHSVPIEGVNVLDPDQMYYIRYSANLGFLDVPKWLRTAVDKKLVRCNHPRVMQSIWDLSCSYSEIPSLTVLRTGKEFRAGSEPIKFTDVYGERNVLHN